MAPKIVQANKQINLRIPISVLKEIDKARGDVPRNAWIRRAIDDRLRKAP